jgi:glucosamine--fructose-6-phosphate aminotransferase (isomerizing)
MCGIVAYTGNKQAYPVLINGLRRLEYRGYDSAGVALLSHNRIHLYKKQGKVIDLENFCSTKNVASSFTGIAHTRWATHGEPNDENAHPHLAEDGTLALIHNGIVENYLSLKNELIERGYVFKSCTDTEVLVHLIQDIKKTENVDLLEAIRMALSVIVGAYALAIVSTEYPKQVIVAKRGSPILIGLGKNEFFVGSDGAPIVEYTQKVVYLNDEEVVVIHPDKELKITNIRNEKQRLSVQKLELKLDQIEKGGFEHYMLKEIFEQPKAIVDSMRGRLNTKKDVVSLGGILEYESKMIQAKRFIIAACGTSWHAGLVAEYIFENLIRVPVEVEYASEFRYRNPVINEEDVLIVISQSGETTDTLAAIELAKQKGATVIGICNVVGSSIARNTHAGSYTHAGPEIGVASTKAFTAQVTVLILMALSLAIKKGKIPLSYYYQLVNGLEAIPKKIETILNKNDEIKIIAQYFKDKHNAIYLGRGVNFPVAMEGALKMKEISYIHAEGYPAAEMKHGPIALIDEEMPVVVVATEQESYEKVVSNIQEVKSRRGKIISIVSEGDEVVKSMSDFCIEIPKTEELLSPLVASIPLQLLAYHVAVLRGCDVDRPRNLAKSVTVE